MKSIFIYNPESGKGKVDKYKNYIISKLSKKYGEIIFMPTGYSGHACEIAKANAESCSYIFVAGGDGTLNEVINGIGECENKPTIGYIPTGTVNDVAHSLGISKNIKKAVNGLMDGIAYSHDIFKVNNHYGIYVCCAGLFTVASFDTKRAAKKRFGKIAYFLRGVKDLFTAKPINVTIETGNEIINQNVALMLILNSRSVAGFMLNRSANLSDGEVEVVLVNSDKTKIRFCDILRCVGLFLFGVKANKNNKHITYFKTDAFHLSTDGGLTINMDGEKCGEGDFDFKVIKGGVKILVTKKSYEKLNKLRG